MKQTDAAIDIAWLHYVGGLTQADIAERRNISKATVHRLIKAAHENGDVRVFVQGNTEKRLNLEQALCELFQLECCLIAPSFDADIPVEKQIDAVASLGAQYLYAYLDTHKTGVIALGAGRTMASMARSFVRINRPDIEFVNLTGEFSVFTVGQSPEVIRRLADRTGGTGYAIAAPMLANTPEDRDVLIHQRGTQVAFEKIKEASISFNGIGHLNRHSFLTEFDLITEQEVQKLKDIGVVADFSGHLLDQAGEIIECSVSQRMISCDIEILRQKKNIAMAAGAEKAPAILSVLRAGLLCGLMVDEDTAQKVLELANL